VSSCPASSAPNYSDPFYLRADLHARLQHEEARFRLLLQFRTDPNKMPLDRATVRWSETESVPVHVATLILPTQDVDQRGQAAYGEHLAFNPWQSPPAHEPVGSIAEARRVVYAASADNRRNVNGIPIAEPPTPRPPFWQRVCPILPPETRESFGPQSTRRLASPASETARMSISLARRLCPRRQGRRGHIATVTTL